MANDKIGAIMISEEQIQKRAREIGAQITEEFKGEEVVLLGILRGGIIWMGDMMKNIALDTQIDFLMASSYGASKETSGTITIRKDVEMDLTGKIVIICEDIIDTGTTLAFLKRYLKAKKAKKVKICCMLDKPSRRIADVNADYVGYEIEDKFVVGYGLDFNQNYRGLPYVACIEED